MLKVLHNSFSSEIVLPSSFRIILSLFKLLFEKVGTTVLQTTVLQNLLLCFDLFGWLRSDQVLEENYFDEKEYSVKSNCSANPQVSVKGRLKTHLDYWENVIGANGVVTSVIKEGYKIPFTYTPQKAYFKNNKSALRNSDFVTDSIKDLLINNLVKETNNIPHVVSPLSVAENSAG